MAVENQLYIGLQPFLECKDHSVSKEKYKLMCNPNYQMLVTLPVPVHLEKYYNSKNYISHTDGKTSLLEKVYQIVRNHTLKQKLLLIDSFNLKSKNILDIGAGTGDFLHVCKKNNWNVFGVEPNKTAASIAAKKGVLLKETLQEYQKKQFDVITLWHVLEHVQNLKEYISILKNILSKNGRLVIAVPNHKSYDAKYYKEFWAAYDVPRHLWHFSQNAIQKLFAEENMCIEKKAPMFFDAYYVSLLSEKYKTGTMNPFKAFYRGFLSNNKAKSSGEYSSIIYVLKKEEDAQIWPF